MTAQGQIPVIDLFSFEKVIHNKRLPLLSDGV